MHEILLFQEELSKQYKYKKLNKKLSEEVRNKYQSDLPIILNENLYTLDGTLIATGYERIVIGDYGAFIEIDESQICLDNVYIPQEQKYRLMDKYYNSIKYLWYTVKDNSKCKLYKQLRGVTYADYKSNMWYISPYEITN